MEDPVVFNEDQADQEGICFDTENEVMQKAKDAMMDAMTGQIEQAVSAALAFPVDFYVSVHKADSKDEADATKRQLEAYSPPDELLVRKVGDSYEILVGACPGEPATEVTEVTSWLAENPEAFNLVGGSMTIVENDECGEDEECCTISINVQLTLLSETSDEGQLYPEDLGCNR